tara:strand:+ start:248 stop:472 length:225 start_codon:yes stop_codon:yes gene_type:complete
MSDNQKRIDQLTLEAQVAVDESNKIQKQIDEANVAIEALKMKAFELAIARDSLKLKAFACEGKIKELQSPELVN